MTILRYKTLKEFPRIPAGEILEKPEGDFVYRGTEHPHFWIDERLVENDPATYEFVSNT